MIYPCLETITGTECLIDNFDVWVNIIERAMLFGLFLGLVVAISIYALDRN